MRKKLLITAVVLFTLTACGSANTEDTDLHNGEITIAVLFDTDFFNYAAEKFEALHNGMYTVTIVEYNDVEAYNQTVNTALMSGRGEDIISVSHMHWQRLANKGRLADFNTLLQFPQDLYYRGVMDAYLHAEERYVVPLNFMINAWRFPDDAQPPEWFTSLTLDNLTTLAADWDAPIFGTVTGLGSNPASVAQMFFDLNNFIDQANNTANVDNEKFIALLEQVASLSGNIRAWREGETSLLWEDVLFTPTMASSGVMDYSNMVLAANDSGQSLATSYSLIAINANSPNHELAAKFTAFLLSEEFQSSPNAGFFNPINKNAAAERARLLLESIIADGYEPENFDLDKNIRMFNQFAERATIAAPNDIMINTFVNEEIERFYKGEVSAEQAAKNLQARLTTYLNE